MHMSHIRFLDTSYTCKSILFTCEVRPSTGEKKKDWAANQPTNPWTKPTTQKRNKVCEVDCWWIHPEPAECFYKCDSLIRKWNMGWSLGCCWTWASQSVFIRTVCSAIIAATGPRDVLQHAAIHHGWHAHTTDDSLSQTSLCYWTPPLLAAVLLL